MIVETTPVFPNNAVTILQTRLDLLDSDLMVFRRPLRESDPVQCMGVFASQWLPNDDSMEMRGAPVSQHEPSLEQYLLAIQGFVKDMDEERGLATHSVMSEMIRTMLYRDTPLRVALTSLVTTLNGVTKRTKGWGIRSQRYFSNELSGSWVYLSTVECWLEVETVPT